MKILITGANGQLGQELAKVFAEEKVIATDNDTLNITNFPQVKKFIQDKKPDWIINSAALTDVDGCAKNPDKANLINGVGPKNLATTAKEIGARLVQVSTNEVFDGTKENPYIETDKVNPINPYGASKVLGERNCLEVLGGGCVVVRTAWLYGPASTRNFPNKIIVSAKEKEKLAVVGDEFGNPTYAPDLAAWIKELIKKGEGGIFHLVNSGSCSRYEWAKQILDAKEMTIPIEKIKLADFKRLSTPPQNTDLSNEKAKRLGLRMREWQEASSEFLAKLAI